MTVSAPQRVAQGSFSTSSSIEEATAELPMLALIFTRKLRPMIIGSSSGWLMLAGMIARPRATSSRTNSGATLLADRDELHLLGDHALPRVVHLRDVAAPAQGFAEPRQRQARTVLAAGHHAFVLPPRQDPRAAQLRQPALELDLGRRIRVRSGRVVDAKRGVDLRFRPASRASDSARSRAAERAYRGGPGHRPFGTRAAVRGRRRHWTGAPLDECSFDPPYGGITRIRFAGSPARPRAGLSAVAPGSDPLRV